MVNANRHVSNARGEVALIDLIHDQMRGFDNRYTVHGRPQLMLDPQLTQNFSLILHELVTNSLKHGALSAADGSVQIKLTEIPTGVLFDWAETGGPAGHCASRRLRRGFRLAHPRPVCARASAPTSSSPTSRRACVMLCIIPRPQSGEKRMAG